MVICYVIWKEDDESVSKSEEPKLLGSFNQLLDGFELYAKEESNLDFFFLKKAGNY